MQPRPFTCSELHALPALAPFLPLFRRSEAELDGSPACAIFHEAFLTEALAIFSPGGPLSAVHPRAAPQFDLHLQILEIQIKRSRLADPTVRASTCRALQHDADAALESTLRWWLACTPATPRAECSSRAAELLRARDAFTVLAQNPTSLPSGLAGVSAHRAKSAMCSRWHALFAAAGFCPSHCPVPVSPHGTLAPRVPHAEAEVLFQLLGYAPLLPPSTPSAVRADMARVALPPADICFAQPRAVLGQGGSGTVLAATHARTGRALAVKCLHAQHPSALYSESLAAFWAEAARHARLSASEYVCPTLGALVLRDAQGRIATLGLVLGAMPGGSLAAALGSPDAPLRALSHVQHLRLLLDAAQGLRLLHASGVSHGHYSSSHLLLDALPLSSARLRLCDFALAREGEVIGASPADVLALGVVLWEVLTLRRAGPHAPLGALPLDLSALPKAAAPWARPLLQRCWSPQPGLRPSAGEVCRELEAALAAAVAVAAVPPPAAPAPQALCCVCGVSEPREPGLHCAQHHFTCHGCLQGLVAAEGDVDNVRATLGSVRCPWRGDVGAGTVELCACAPWDFTCPALQGKLTPATAAALHAALVSALRGSLAESERLSQRIAVGELGGGGGGSGAGAAPQGRAGPPPLPLNDRLAAAEAQVLALHPPRPGEGGALPCPGCTHPFIDYSDCAAVQCGCGRLFCALCLKSFATQRAAHDHFLERGEEGGAHRRDAVAVESFFFSEQQFHRWHKHERWARIKAWVAALSESAEFKAALLLRLGCK